MANWTPFLVGIIGGLLSIACTPRDKTPPPSAPVPHSEPAKNPVKPNNVIVPATPTPKNSTEEVAPVWRESLHRYALIQLQTPSFSNRTPREKRQAFHWAKAVEAGHIISLDQRHRLGWPLRASLNAIMNKSTAGSQETQPALQDYAGQVWIANGPYDRETGEKFQPSFERATWRKALQSISEITGAWSPRTADELETLIFDARQDSRLVFRHARGRLDPLMASGGNLYVDVGLKDLKGFESAYPTNSRLVKRDGSLVEEVYRSGRTGSAAGRPAPAGRYAAQLRAVCNQLRQGLAYATESQKQMVMHLIEHLESGDSDAFDRFNIAWLKDRSSVQVMAGFIETDLDPRGVKGEWEGTVLIRDDRVSQWIEAIVSSAQYFEDRSPWDAAYKKTWGKTPVPSAMEVLVGSGGTAPVLPTVVDLPNKPGIREQHGSRTVFLTNVIRAIDGAIRERGVDAFMLAKDRSDAHRYGAVIDGLELVLHEVIGHGSGKVSDEFDHKQPAVALREYATAVEEARAILVALHHLWDPRIRSIVPECPDACAASALEQFVTHDLMQLRWVQRDRLEDHHRRAVHLIVQYARAKGAVSRVDQDGKVYQHITDMVAMRTVVKNLLAELMRIKAVGDYDAARRMFEEHGLMVDARVRAQISRRAHACGLPGRYAFVMPELRMEGEDVQMKTPASFQQQQRAYSVPAAAP